jgi:hypothetical protein
MRQDITEYDGNIFQLKTLINSKHFEFDKYTLGYILYCRRNKDKDTNFDLIRYLIKHKNISVSKSDIFLALTYSTFKMFQYLLDKYLKINISYFTATHILIEILLNNRYCSNIICSTIRILIKRGANINYIYNEYSPSSTLKLRLNIFIIRQRLQLLIYLSKKKGVNISSFIRPSQWLMQKFKKDPTTLHKICAFL